MNETKLDILRRLTAALDSAHDCYQELLYSGLSHIERMDWKLDADNVETAKVYARNEFNGAIVESREVKACKA